MYMSTTLINLEEIIGTFTTTKNTSVSHIRSIAVCINQRGAN